MEPLETTLKVQGRTLRQLRRVGMIAIYELRNPGQLLLGYEVIRIRVKPAQEVFGRQYLERECYPSSARDSPDWGTIAWSFGRNQRREAMAMFNGLVGNERKRPAPTPHAPH